ncbi:MAG: hypothetical protein GTN62_03330 [Gemmatimonadales bacterium]|nr:hypothetical protein [Gemmatimonadales bacterium]NIN49133.1 hypothetical protein [Gemmatimonadales bacterium]NIP06597.1 hypothetical protein [Gemmatimonadales bacterium]NIR00294.1 hypothetical protein [Gemmatimonadales bacterium]NIS64627.1 hypothetical protein [Gemmatimonadales bacterium]
MKRKSRRALAELAAQQADEALLVKRLEALGLDGALGVQVHENRTVLVSVGANGALRVHRGYAYASDRVLRAVLTFTDPDAMPADQRDAECTIVGFPVEDFVDPVRRRRGERRRRGDRKLLAELQELHRRFNHRHFGGALAAVEFRISSRMRTSLGELTVDPQANRATEIALSRRHIESDSWEEVEQTVLHEMVHQWQVESGGEPDHGPSFRRKAVAVGIAPWARRIVTEPQPAVAVS